MAYRVPRLLKICVIDDIRSVVDMIARKPDWQKHGIEVAGTALDGEEGLQMIRGCMPDIVLTDIRMPRMDGLEMTRAILICAPVQNHHPQRIFRVFLCAAGDPPRGDGFCQKAVFTRRDCECGAEGQGDMPAGA